MGIAIRLNNRNILTNRKNGHFQTKYNFSIINMNAQCLIIFGINTCINTAEKTFGE